MGIKSAFSSFEPYIKIFLVRRESKIYPITGSKPDKKANQIYGITAFINKAKRDPSSIPQFINDINTERSWDPIISYYLSKISIVDNITIPEIRSLDQNTHNESSGSVDDALLLSLDSLSFDIKEEEILPEDAISPSPRITEVLDLDGKKP